MMVKSETRFRALIEQRLAEWSRDNVHGLR